MDIESINRMSKRGMVPWEAPKSTLLLRERCSQCPAGVESKNIRTLRKYNMLFVYYGNDTIKENGCYGSSSMMHDNRFSFQWSFTVYSVTVEFQWTENGMPE